MTKCAMKGFLSFLLLWLISQKNMNGADIASEIEKRKGYRPSPGTIYPALKSLREDGLIDCDKDIRYSLTKKGKKEIKILITDFNNLFYDVTQTPISIKGKHLP